MPTRVLARLRRHARDQGQGARDRVGRGRRRDRHERQGVHRRDGGAVVLQRRLRQARDRGRGRGAADPTARLLVLRGVHDRRHASRRRAPRGPVADPERGRVPRLRRFGRDRHRGQAGPPLLGRRREAGQDAAGLARARLSRDARDGHVARSACRSCATATAASRSSTTSSRCRRSTSTRSRACSSSAATRSRPSSASRSSAPAASIPPPDGYWREISALCKRYDILLIADEVITGFGRTGRMWGTRAVRHRARHDHLRQGRHLGLHAARRRARGRARPLAVLGRADSPARCSGTATRTPATRVRRRPRWRTSTSSSGSSSSSGSRRWSRSSTRPCGVSRARRSWARFAPWA